MFVYITPFDYSTSRNKILSWAQSIKTFTNIDMFMNECVWTELGVSEQISTDDKKYIVGSEFKTVHKTKKKPKLQNY